MKRVTALTAALAVALPVVPSSAGQGYSAVLRYTENGVPHIKSDTLGGVGLGYGYAAAQDNICALADIYVTLRAQRSLYFGPSAPGNRALGEASTSLASDLYFQQVNDSGLVERQVARPAPLGPLPDVREIVKGYVSGYNRYVASGKITDPECKGAAWVRPIAEIDVYRHMHALWLLSGEGMMIDGITSAQPPAGVVKAPDIPADASARAQAGMASTQDRGSNAIAVGRDAATGGKGVLLGNPHFPWADSTRFWQAQLTVPGKLDVSGGSLLGLPFVQIGYNRDVAWSHTVSDAKVFSLVELRLVPGSPTTYLVDGKPEQMTSREVTVRLADGSTVERTLWSTRYGPVLDNGFDTPMPWTSDTAYVVKDVNADNSRSLNMWYELAKARNTGEIVQALSSTLGAPWINTIATDRSGNALYADIQAVPNITGELAQRCNTALGKAIFPDTGIAVLDGSQSSCNWVTDPDAVQPGLIGPARLPLLTRTDFVSNSNNSPWLANPHAPITGYPRVVGTVGKELSPRARMALTELDGKKISLQSIQDILYSDRSYMGELAMPDVLRMCSGATDIADACAALAKWDRAFTTSSRGALLFERFWGRVPVSKVLKVPFDANDPVRTPNTVDTDNPAVHQALLDAAADLRAAGIPLDSPLGDAQYVVRNGERISIPGAPGWLGVLNVVNPHWDSGNVDVRSGSSYIQTVSFGSSPCPSAGTVMTYSQSSDPTSPHYSDQTKLFSQGKWVRGRYCEQDILSSPALQVVTLHG
jgi:acyl-homoserine-lactone acylase